jgi:hypothetical protein
MTEAMLDIAPHKARIEAALEHSGGTHTYEDIVRGIEDERFQLWPGVHATVVTEMIWFPQKKVIHCFLAAGDLAEIHAIRSWAEEWARRAGCASVTITGRPGWERVLASDGYTKQSVTLEKDLKGVPDGLDHK